MLLLCTDVAFTHVLISIIHSQYDAAIVLFVFVRRKNKVHKVFFYTAEIKYCRQPNLITQNVLSETAKKKQPQIIICNNEHCMLLVCLKQNGRTSY